MRELKFWQAISEGIVQAMEADESVFLFGVGVDDPKGIFGTCLEANKRFGPKRVFDVPISEPALTGAAIGASLLGMRPVMVHARNDFMLLTLDQLINNASKWRYGGGHSHVPITIRGIVGRGWGQGPQHSQSLQATFAHFPGLKVVMPATPYDAKGLLIGSIRDNSPVIFIEHRRCYDQAGPVPEKYYEEPLGKAAVRRKGTDVTIVATSLMVSESLKAAESLQKQGVSVEVVDLRTIKPMDDETVLESVRRTGRLVVADTSWQSFGVASEVISRVTTKLFGCLKAPPQLVASPDVPSPTSFALERLFYPGPDEITVKVLETVKGKVEPCAVPGKSTRPIDEDFRGPF